MCGSLIMEAAKENNVRLLPVDSEISAIFQCLSGVNRDDGRRDRNSSTDSHRVWGTIP